MKRLFIVLLCLVPLTGILSIKAQVPEFFTPVHQNALRLPAVPLVTVDPFFCLWSKYDHLYDGSVTHWNGTKKPLNGAIYVDDKAYRFMGESLEAIYPLAAEKAWTGKYVNSKPSGAWTSIGYDDSSWESGEAPWGGSDDGYEKTVKTPWTGSNTDIYVRRTFTLDTVEPDAIYYLMYKHDDVFQLYVNGTQVVSTGETWDVSGTAVRINSNLLHEGENVLACHCHNTSGGAYVDMGIYLSVLEEAQQKSCTVNATSTYYTFQCGGIDLDVVFTTPQVMDDLVLFSTPISYISYQVKPNDGQQHDVRLYLQTSAEMAIRNTSQTAATRRKTSNGYEYLYAGNQTQSYLSHTGDIIDWGYLYMFNDNAKGHNLKLGKHDDLMREFASHGTVTSAIKTRTNQVGTYYSMVYNDSLGIVTNEGKRAFAMIGYDDSFSIQYFKTNRKGYWANNGRTNITARFQDLYENYDDIMQQCRNTDLTIYNDGYEVGGQKYAEILAAVYRQTNAAHKLFLDTKGNLMFMSRENNSGGFINTLDVTYPSQPLYWVYSPALAKAMITPVFEYSALGKWNYDFPNHDLGHYPLANGNHYGNPSDGSGSTMPVEQSGNMLTLAAIIAQLDGDLDYLRKYLPYMTKWADYLVENGKDPANQLCTDDFMGHSARNTNLATKAIMGVMSYSEILRMLGDEEGADEYKAKAQDMVTFWKQNAVTSTNGRHYLLNFGADGKTWSSKYNLVWDKIWGWNLMKDVRTSEMSFYMDRMQAFGLPLDSRGNYCKNDWQMWVMGFADLKSQRTTLINTLWKYINETTSRVPVSDNHDVKSGKQAMFQARSVVGGYWMRVFVEQYLAGTLTGIDDLKDSKDLNDSRGFEGKWYDLYGHQTGRPAAPGIYIKNGKKTIIK
ncbi:MAG: DUF4965 domain-containing protein [Bacteroidaceae bacterium]|nr:DUF4965 domain-containing protein [Bacteroidaceae bacterium]